jgi:two-component system, NtrC family, sensor kinase
LALIHTAELTDELNGVLKPVAMGGKVRGEVDELTGLLKGNLENVARHGKRADTIVKNMLLHSREGSGEQRSADNATSMQMQARSNCIHKRLRVPSSI